MTPVAKSRRPQAERAAEWVAVEVFGCTETQRATRTKFQKIDFFGCDVMGMRPGFKEWIQVTAGQRQAVQVRRKKLVDKDWVYTDRVWVFRLVQEGKSGRIKLWHFDVWKLEIWEDIRKWEDWPPIPIKPEWFKARKDT